MRANVRFGLDVKKMPVAERDAKVERILENSGLTESATEAPIDCPAGQKQRIALARALVVEPDILLLDEPLGALDANLRKSIQNELKLLQRRLGITFVFVTHAQSEALALSDRIVVMNAGRIEQISAPYELYTRPQTLFVAKFIGRNALIPGRVRGCARGWGPLFDTAFGQLAGAGPVERSGSWAAAASLAVPAEAIDVLPLSTPPRRGAGDLRRPCPFKAARSSPVEQVGHIVQIGVLIGRSRANLGRRACRQVCDPVRFRPGAKCCWPGGVMLRR